MASQASRSAVVLVLAVALALGSCAKHEASKPVEHDSTQGTGSFSLAVAAQPYKGQTIRVLGEALPPLEALSKLKSEFESKTGIHVEVEGFAYDTMIERGALDVSAGTGRYDILLQAPEAWGRLAASGQLLPLDHFRNNPRLADPSFRPETALFQKVWHDLGWYDGVAYGYPFSALTMAMWYRRDLIEDPAEGAAFKAKYGHALRAPTTWKEFREVAEFFTRPNKGLYGTLVQGKRHAALWQEWLNFAFSFGGGTLHKENGWEYGEIIANCPETVAATDYYRSLLRFSPPGTLEYSWDDALAAMQQGKVAMALMWTDMSSAIEDPKTSKVAGKMGYAKPPAGPGGSVSQISGAAYLIPKTAKHPDAAFLFINWLMRPENQVAIHLAGGQSGSKAVYKDPRVLALPYARGVFETLEVGISMRETIPEASAIGEAVQIQLSDILRGKKSSQQGLGDLAIELERILGAKAVLACPLKLAA